MLKVVIDVNTYQWKIYYKKVLNCCIKVCYYEILTGMWVRNGHQIRGQAMTYIQSHFCKSTIDIDIYLLQVIAYCTFSTFFFFIVLSFLAWSYL